jgi:glycosyltransferase involved in cell wall biosynthesis
MTNQNKKTKKIVFLWNNFGPMHADRVDAVARHLPDRECVGIELYKTDKTYSWISEDRSSFKKISLLEKEGETSFLKRCLILLNLRITLGKSDFFLCHYERPEIFILALWLRLTGARVYTMGCSKFDDKDRSALREYLKTFSLRPYHGAIGSENRSASYFSFLGLSKRRITTPYNTLSLDRMRRQASCRSIHEASIPFEDRAWAIVARLVPKKNLSMALMAYQDYRNSGGIRPLRIFGDGALDSELKSLSAELKIDSDAEFKGFMQSHEISQYLSQSFALILPSTEEQFGNVVIEAQALGLPVLLSDICGARDKLVRNWQNGFVFEPDNPKGLAKFMLLLDQDKNLWETLSQGAERTAPQGDVLRFAEAVTTLIIPSS